jgi:hypothetical protein
LMLSIVLERLVLLISIGESVSFYV